MSFQEQWIRAGEEEERASFGLEEAGLLLEADEDVGRPFAEGGGSGQPSAGIDEGDRPVDDEEERQSLVGVEEPQSSLGVGEQQSSLGVEDWDRPMASEDEQDQSSTADEGSDSDYMPEEEVQMDQSWPAETETEGPPVTEEETPPMEEEMRRSMTEEEIEAIFPLGANRYLQSSTILADKGAPSTSLNVPEQCSESEEEPEEELEEEPKRRRSRRRQKGRKRGEPYKSQSRPGNEDWLHTVSLVDPSDKEVEVAPLKYMRPGYSILVPTVVDRVCNPPPGHIGVYMKLFKAGLRFPSPYFLTLVLHLLGIPLYCYTPNSILNLLSYYQICANVKVEPTVRLFRWIFQVTRHKEGYYQIQARKGRMLVEKLWSKVVYRDDYVFVAYPPGTAPPAPAELDLRRAWIRNDIEPTDEEWEVLGKLFKPDESDRQALCLNSASRAAKNAWPREPLMADLLDEMIADQDARIAGEAPLIPGKRKADPRLEALHQKKTRQQTTGGESSTRPSTAATAPPVTQQAKDKHLALTSVPAKESGPDKGKGSGPEQKSRVSSSLARKAQPSEKETSGSPEAFKAWPYVGSSRPHLGMVDPAVHGKLAVFGPRVKLPPPEYTSSGLPRHKIYSTESIFEDASVACRVADNAVTRRDRVALNNANKTRLVDTIICYGQQLSAMGVSLRPSIEESSVLEEKLRQAEDSEHQARRELQEEKRRADEATRKIETAMRFRQIAEDSAKAAEQRRAKLEEELKRKDEALQFAEEEMTRAKEKWAEEMAEARKRIEKEYTENVVQPRLAGMSKRAHRKGYGEGFRAAVAYLVAEHPELPSGVETLDVGFEGDAVFISGGVEVIGKGLVPSTKGSADEIVQTPMQEEVVRTEGTAQIEEPAQEEPAQIEEPEAAERSVEPTNPAPAAEGTSQPDTLMPLIEDITGEENGNSGGMP